jgi:hypothetical protein
VLHSEDARGFLCTARGNGLLTSRPHCLRQARRKPRQVDTLKPELPGGRMTRVFRASGHRAVDAAGLVPQHATETPRVVERIRRREVRDTPPREP